MKKRSIFFLFLLLVAVLGFWCLPRKLQPPTVATSFLGFTNVSGRQEALFALSNPPPASVSLHSVRRLSSVTDVDAREAGHFSWAMRESWGMPYAVSVATTNEPLRVVFQFQQRAVGPGRITEQIRELFGRVSGNEREFFTGNVFFVTNETTLP